MLGFKNIAIGPYNVAKAYCIVRQIDTRFAVVIFCLQLCFIVAFVVLNPLRYFVTGLWAFGWLAYLAFVTVLAVQKNRIRNYLGYSGNVLEDVFTSLFSYPSVGYQVELELKNGLEPREAPPVTYR